MRVTTPSTAPECAWVEVSSWEMGMRLGSSMSVSWVIAGKDCGQPKRLDALICMLSVDETLLAFDPRADDRVESEAV